MPHLSIESISQIYFKRFKSYPPQISPALRSDTKIVWIIPCYHEPDILNTLRSLAKNAPPKFPVELLIVINASQEESDEIIQQNNRSQKQITQWIASEKPKFLDCHIITACNLPPKHAGVGFARKIGMDEALRRFASIGYDGLIMNLDADCTVSPNYFQEVEKAWLKKSPSTVTVYFEHNLEHIDQPELREGIIFYELFLRYYINGLRYAKFPFAFHTVGSCMGSRASTYAVSGGMNKRKAGEDFYFLHKIAPIDKFLEITSTTVYPSARTSDRVPFGTGKAQQEWLTQSDRHRYLYHPQTFEDLKLFLENISSWYESYKHWPQMSEINIPNSLRCFLESHNFEVVWNDLHSSTRSWPIFLRRFFAWWDGLRVLKFVHYARDNHYTPLRTEEAGFRLLQKLCILNAEGLPTAEELLDNYRKFDRQQY